MHQSVWAFTVFLSTAGWLINKPLVNWVFCLPIPLGLLLKHMQTAFPFRTTFWFSLSHYKYSKCKFSAFKHQTLILQWCSPTTHHYLQSTPYDKWPMQSQELKYVLYLQNCLSHQFKKKIKIRGLGCLSNNLSL